MISPCLIEPQLSIETTPRLAGKVDVPNEEEHALHSGAVHLELLRLALDEYDLVG